MYGNKIRVKNCGQNGISLSVTRVLCHTVPFEELHKETRRSEPRKTFCVLHEQSSCKKMAENAFASGDHGCRCLAFENGVKKSFHSGFVHSRYSNTSPK